MLDKLPTIPASDVKLRTQVIGEGLTKLDGELRDLVNNSTSRGLTANEEKYHDAVKNRIQEFQAELEHENEKEAASTADWRDRRGLSHPGEAAERASQGLPPFPVATDDGTRPGGTGEALPAARPGLRELQGEPMSGRRFADLFGRPAADNVSPEEFIRSIHSGRFDPRLQRAAAHTEQLGSTGGFLAPDQMTAHIHDTSLEMEIVRPRAAVFPMEGMTLRVPGIAIGDHTSGALLGGITGAWIPETGSMDEETAQLRLITLRAWKRGIYSTVSNEAGADTVIQSLIGDKFPLAMSWHHDDAFINGTGAGQPMGILNDPALVTVAKETGQGGATIVYENCIKMLARLHPALLNGAIWLANPTAIPQLLQLSIGVGTAGVHFPVLRETDGGAWSMLTRPILFSEKLPSLGTKGDLLLVNFSQYLIGMRKDTTVDRSMHVGFQNDTTAFRLISRLDGRGAWDKAFTPKNGDTQSWCVALAARS
jgi:HK97 family phage major capsid protein